METDNGKLSTYFITILGILVALYFIFKPMIDPFLNQQFGVEVAAAIILVIGVAYNLLYPRLSKEVKDLLDQLKPKEESVEDGA
jgi:uncharacterized membrane protein